MPFGDLLGAALVTCLLFVPAWWLVAVPFYRGFRQTFRLVHPIDEAMRNANDRVAKVLDEIRDAHREAMDRVASSVLEETKTWLLRKWEGCFEGDSSRRPKPTFLKDAKILITKGLPVWGHWVDHFQPRLSGWQELPVQDKLWVTRDLLAWLDKEDVNAVIQVAGARLGLGAMVVSRKKSELRENVVEEAHTVSKGLWYTLYCTVAFQLLVVEALYAFHLPGALKPVLWFFGGVNLLNLVLAFQESWPYVGVYFQERQVLHEILFRFGIEKPAQRAAGVVFGQATAALFLAAFMVRTALYFDQERILPWIHATILGVVWKWPMKLIPDLFKYS